MKKQKITKEKVVVVGGAGFIGGHLGDALVKEGYEVHVIDNLCAGKMENVNAKAIFHKVDILDLNSLKKIIKGAEFVFHLAALPRVQFSLEHPKESNDVNVNGTLNVLIACTEAGVKRLVYSASGSAYGDQEKMPLQENMEAHPKSPYGLQKYIGELYCRLWSEIYQLPTVSLRYFNVYGSRQDPNGPYALVVGKFLKQMKEGHALTITGDGKQTRDFTHVRDVARANLLAAKSKKVGNGEVINIGAGRNFSILQLAKLISKKVEFIPARLEPSHALADRKRAKELLDWEPKEMLEEGIAELKKEMGL